MRVVKQLKPLPSPLEFSEDLNPTVISISYIDKQKSLIGLDSLGELFRYNLAFQKNGKGWGVGTMRASPNFATALPIMIRLKDSLLLGIATTTRKDGVVEYRILKQNKEGKFGNEQWAEPIPAVNNYRRSLVQDPWTGRIFYLSVNRPPSDSNKFAATILELNTKWKTRKFANNLLQNKIQVRDLALTTTPDGRIILFAQTLQGLRMYATAKNYLQSPNEFLGCPGNCFTGENPIFKEIELPDFLKKINDVVPASLSLARIVGRTNLGAMLSVGVKSGRNVKYISVPMYSIIDADAQEAWEVGNTLLTVGEKKNNPTCFSTINPEASDYFRSAFAFRGVYQTYIVGNRVHYRIIHENGSVKAGLLNKPDSTEGIVQNLHTVSLRVGDSIAFLSLWNEGAMLRGNLVSISYDTIYEKVKIVPKMKPEDYDNFTEDDHAEETFLDISGGYFSPKFILDLANIGQLAFSAVVAAPVTFALGKLWSNTYSLTFGASVYTFSQKITIAQSGQKQQQELSFVRVTQYPLAAGYRLALPSPRWHLGASAGFQLFTFNSLVRHAQRQSTKGSGPLDYRTGYNKTLKVQPFANAYVEYSIYKKLAVTAQVGYLFSSNGYLQTVIYNSTNKPDFFYSTRLQGLSLAAGLRLFPGR